jgi:hypothetical protein
MLAPLAAAPPLTGEEGRGEDIVGELNLGEEIGQRNHSRIPRRREIEREIEKGEDSGRCGS